MNYPVYVSTLALVVSCVSSAVLGGNSSALDTGIDDDLGVQLVYQVDPNADSLGHDLSLILHNPPHYVRNERNVIGIANKSAIEKVASSQMTQIRQMPSPISISFNVFGTNTVTLVNDSDRSVRFRTQYLPVIIPLSFGFSTLDGIRGTKEARVTYGLPIGDANLRRGETRTLSLSPLLIKDDMRKCKLMFIILTDDGHYSVVNTPWIYLSPERKASQGQTEKIENSHSPGTGE